MIGYVGTIVTNILISLYFLNWVAAGVFLCILVPVILVRIGIEEKMLFGIEGHTAFARKRKRLFPIGLVRYTEHLMRHETR